MERNLEIAKELKEMHASLPEIKAPSVFQVPDGYFSQLPEAIFDEIHSREITKNWSTQNPYPLNEDYFDTLPDKIIKRLTSVSAKEEIDELSPLLAGLKAKTTYQLPREDYFEQKNKKVIPFPTYQERAQKRIRWTRWVAAAAVACLFVLGGYNYLSPVYHQRAFDKSVESALAGIPNDEIQEYLSVHLDANDFYGMANGGGGVLDESVLNGVSNKEIEAALENYSY